MQVKLYRGTSHLSCMCPNPLLVVLISTQDSIHRHRVTQIVKCGRQNYPCRLSWFATYPFLPGGTITKLAIDKFTRSKTICANFMKLCALTFHNWLKLHVENTNVEKNYRSPSLSLLQIRKFIPQSELPTMSPFSNDNLTSQLPKIKDFATKLSHTTRSPISISHTASSCCWAHV